MESWAAHRKQSVVYPQRITVVCMMQVKHITEFCKFILPQNQKLITVVYKSLALKYHQDLNTSLDAIHRMQEINESYEFMSNKSKCVEYDKEQTARFTTEEIVVRARKEKYRQ